MKLLLATAASAMLAGSAALAIPIGSETYFSYSYYAADFTHYRCDPTTYGEANVGCPHGAEPVILADSGGFSRLGRLFLKHGAFDPTPAAGITQQFSADGASGSGDTLTFVDFYSDLWFRPDFLDITLTFDDGMEISAWDGIFGSFLPSESVSFSSEPGFDEAFPGVPLYDVLVFFEAADPAFSSRRGYWSLDAVECYEEGERVDCDFGPTPIPLPAGGLLLIAGLAGLLGVRASSRLRERLSA